MNAEQLREWRKRFFASQSEAAQALGRSPRRYQELESGRLTIKKETELACGAIAAGITHYPPEGENHG